MTNSLLIVNKINKKYAISQEDAAQILPSLEDSIVKNESLDLSFEGLENCSTIFLNTLLGTLYLNFGVKVDSFIRFVGISPDDLVLPIRLEKLRKRILNPEIYKPILDNFL